MPDTSQITRYEKVKEILDRAAGESCVDYDGYGPFWKLPLDDFLKFELRGIRMIATPEEAPVHSCCHGPTMETGKSRSARSGLIQGLRGQTPFDGTQFPPLPWAVKAFPTTISVLLLTGSTMVVAKAIVRLRLTSRPSRRLNQSSRSIQARLRRACAPSQCTKHRRTNTPTNTARSNNA